MTLAYIRIPIDIYRSLFSIIAISFAAYIAFGLIKMSMFCRVLKGARDFVSFGLTED